MTLLMLVCVALMAVTGPARACTSFAAYGEKTYYGMNFDYPQEFEVRFFIDSVDDMKIFHMAFMQGRHPIRTAGMNSSGLFSAVQELYPEEPGHASAGPDSLYTWQLYFRALNEFESVEDVTTLLASHRIVQHPSKTLHVFVADADGRAIVVEDGENANRITPIEGTYHVMTNFCVADFVGAEPGEIAGVGAERYIAADAYLNDHGDAMTIDRAFEVLRQTAWRLTRTSMVFDPAEGSVYLALERDFDRIFRVSIEDGTIEAFSGHDEPATWHVGRLGTKATELASGRPGVLARLRGLIGL
jgi:hypothetical protein